MSHWATEPDWQKATTHHLQGCSLVVEGLKVHTTAPGTLVLAPGGVGSQGMKREAGLRQPWLKLMEVSHSGKQNVWGWSPIPTNIMDCPGHSTKYIKQ